MTIKSSMHRDEELPDDPKLAPLMQQLASIPVPAPNAFQPPAVHYSRAGDQLKLFWDKAEAFADEIDDRARITILRAFKDNDKITGAKIWGLSEVLPNLGAASVPPLDRSKDEDPIQFKPYAGFDGEHDALIVRWRAGKAVHIPLAGPRPLTLFVDEQHPTLIIGFALPEVSAIARKHPDK